MSDEARPLGPVELDTLEALIDGWFDRTLAENPVLAAVERDHDAAIIDNALFLLFHQGYVRNTVQFFQRVFGRGEAAEREGRGAADSSGGGATSSCWKASS